MHTQINSSHSSNSNFTNAPSYKLAKLLTDILKTHIPLPDVFNVQNSTQLMNDISQLPFVPGTRLASLDISNMYTNIPTKDLINIISNVCKTQNIEETIAREIMLITNLIITQNYFNFQDITYIQDKGLAMGAPTSSILSKIYLQYLENTKIFNILNEKKIVGYFRYVDDILIIYNENITRVSDVLKSFNDLTPNMTFTLEKERENKLNFLDISITKTKDKMSFGIYRKETTSDIIIPNDSCHPTEQKLVAIRYFTNRINTYNLDHNKKQAEENIVKQIVSNNKFNTSVLNKSSGRNTRRDKDIQKNRWAKFTYCGKETRMITKLFKNTDVKVTTNRTKNNLGTVQPRLVLKGVPSNVPEEVVRADLISHNIQVVRISQLTKADRVTHTVITKYPTFVITFPTDTDIRKVLHIHKLCQCIVKWEKFKNSRPVRQCFNCQSFGHSSNFCGKPSKCVKCDQSHASKDCTKPASTPPKCTNCGGDHPANFSGCPRYQQQLQYTQRTTN